VLTGLQGGGEDPLAVVRLTRAELSRCRCHPSSRWRLPPTLPRRSGPSSRRLMRHPRGGGIAVRRDASVLAVDARCAVQRGAGLCQAAAGEEPRRQRGQPRDVRTQLSEGGRGRAHGQSFSHRAEHLAIAESCG
jgi:hypothetical protein